MLPPHRGEGLLKGIEALFRRLDASIERFLPSSLNPLGHTGALANGAFLIAAASGILLLPFYSVSVVTAHSSVEALSASFALGLLRSVHRHSSDLTLLFALLHGLRLFGAKRFSGPRTLAWLTGILLVGALWFVGWLGYWLVWDQRAQSVALGTAKLFDGLPIFAEPLSRSFLTNEGVNSLLFFMVFFFHMLIPLAMGALLWLHISHLSRARFLPRRPMWLFLGGWLLFAALLSPARSAPPADLLQPETSFGIDAFYLLPLWFTDRLSGPALWAGGLATFLLAGLVPLLFRARRKIVVAEVDSAKCNGCTLCYEDCPYDAIRMVPRTDGRNYELQAEVDPSRCVGCGICAGACDSGGIGLPILPVVDERKRIEARIQESLAAAERPRLAFVCASARASAPAGYQGVEVPCTGWVQRFTIERAIVRGAEEVLLVGCGSTEPHFREGLAWSEARLRAERRPALRHERLGEGKVRLVADEGKTIAEVPSAESPAKDRGDRRRILGIALAVVGVGGVVAFGSHLPYVAPPPQSELVVSFRHPGQASEDCRELSAVEKARLPAHMQRDSVCERGRADVRLRVEVDGETVLREAYKPRGLRSDGNSVAIERFPLSAGDHRVRISLADGPDPEAWSFHDERTVRIASDERVVVLFDRDAGFQWHGGD